MQNVGESYILYFICIFYKKNTQILKNLSLRNGTGFYKISTKNYELIFITLIVLALN